MHLAAVFVAILGTVLTVGIALVALGMDRPGDRMFNVGMTLLIAMILMVLLVITALIARILWLAA